MEGYWTGALIRGGNSVQIMTAEVYRQGDSLVIGVSIPDWPNYPPRISKLEREGNLLSFDTYYGGAKMMLDTSYLEMTGKVADAAPPYNFHLKKSLRPYSRPVLARKLEISNKGANIGGILYYPADVDEALSCAILVHGRGCGTRNWKKSRARLLAEYGIATFVYDKRGSTPSGFPCEESTHDLNVSDVKKIASFLSKQSGIDGGNIGLISYSAGGWVAPEVAVDEELAFLITVVGPTTSVKEQQIDGLEAFLKAEGYDNEDIKDAVRYTELMFSESNYEEAWREMQKLIDAGDNSGWTDWLVEDDYAATPEDLKKMWVQRFGYDPADDLKRFQGPYLAIFGEKDNVVPYEKQLERLVSLMSSAGKTNYHTRVVAEGFHNLEHGPKVRELGNLPETRSPVYYFKYDRVGYGAFQYIVDFLTDYEFLMD
jgi:pimeloyl-ACP methyl ester carboxylesterase